MIALISPNPRIQEKILIVSSLVNNSKHWNVSLEPIGGSKPQFSSSSTISNYKAGLGSKFALICPAQAHPLPGFRLVFERYLEIDWIWSDKCPNRFTQAFWQTEIERKEIKICINFYLS